MKAFTLVEILFSVGILAILTTLISPLLLNFYKSHQLDTNTQAIIQTLRIAQSKAMSIENNSNFGVYVSADNYTLFKGNSYTIRDAQYDEVFDLPEFLNISGLQEIVFSKFEGKPNITGNIILSYNSESRTISINRVGRINLE